MDAVSERYPYWPFDGISIIFWRVLGVPAIPSVLLPERGFDTAVLFSFEGGRQPPLGI
jgi:hypothetical protein